MAGRILIEILLFTAPFIVFALYRAASRDLSIKDRWPLTWLVVAGGVLAVAALVIAPLLEESEEGQCYLAPRYEDGVRTPGRLVDCSEISGPEREAPPPARQPVAPRNEAVGERE